MDLIQGHRKEPRLESEDMESRPDIASDLPRDLGKMSSPLALPFLSAQKVCPSLLVLVCEGNPAASLEAREDSSKESKHGVLPSSGWWALDGIRGEEPL